MKRRALTEIEIEIIRRGIAAGHKQAYLAAVHHVTQATISNVHRGKGVYAQLPSTEARQEHAQGTSADGAAASIPETIRRARAGRSDTESNVDLDGDRSADRCPVGCAPGFSGLDTRRHAVRIDRR